MPRKYLKGFSRFTIFPLTENTIEKYLVGEGIKIPSAQKLSKEIDSEEENILADDEIWDVDKTVNGEKFTLTLKELPNDLREKLEGGKYNEETREYDFSTTDNAPEFACTYRGLLADGTYRMFRQYKCKVTKIKMDLETKGASKDGAVELEGMFMARSYDNKLFTIKDTEAGNADLVWLDTIPTVPATVVTEQEPLPDSEPDQGEKEEDLSKMTKEQLLAKATELGITEVSEDNTESEIIAAIEAKLSEVQETIGE